jgi:serine/threonine protein kinase
MKTFTASKKTELEKDAAILENLKHPNILQLIFCIIQPKSCSLVLELMSTDLNKFIQGRISPDNEVPFTLPVALDIMLQIARGLKYIHERGVGHRDIKPSNILMTPTPVPELVEMGYVEVKLADFGMAKAKLNELHNQKPDSKCWDTTVQSS